jgi:HK97 family phage major capsid protein
MKKKQLIEQLAALKLKRDALLAVTEPENIVEHLAASKAADAEVAAAQQQLDAFIELETLAKANATREPARVISDNEAKRPFANLGEQLQAVAFAQSPRGSFHGQGGQIDKRLFETNLAASGANATVPTEGGFLIGTEFSTALLGKARDTARIFPLCKEIPIGEGNDSVELPFIDETSRATGSRWGGIRVYRAAETDSPTASKPTIGRQELKLESLKGIAYASDRLLRNAPAMSAIFEDGFASEMAFTLDNEIWRGTGVGQCLGFASAAFEGTALMVEVAKETSQTAATINVNNVAKMLARLRRSSNGNVRWLVNQDTLSQFTLMTLGQVPVYLPGGSVANAGLYGTLYGIPILPVEQAETLGTAGDIVLADLSQYIVISQGGIRGAQSMHVRFIYDEMTFKWSWDVNGQPAVKKPLTPFKGTNKISPFVSLATRS